MRRMAGICAQSERRVKRVNKPYLFLNNIHTGQAARMRATTQWNDLNVLECGKRLWC